MKGEKEKADLGKSKNREKEKYVPYLFLQGLKVHMAEERMALG